MAGHNKWNNIKGRKGAQDQRKSKAFFEVTKMIRSAVKSSHIEDPNMNAPLRLALEKARAVNLPKEHVQRAIDRAMGRSESGQSIQEVTYEGYGPHGVGFMVVAATDNVQRTAGNIRFLFSRHGGALAGPGSVAFLFKREGGEFIPTIPMPLTPEQVPEIEALYDALGEDDDVEEVYTNGQWERDDADEDSDA